MAQKIEVDPFIRKDIIGILEDNVERLEEPKSECEVDAVPTYRFDHCLDEIMEKLTEFVNENYTPKP